MKVIPFDEFLRVLEDDLGNGDLTQEKIRALAEELAEELEVFSLEEVTGLLEKGAPVGANESKLLASIRRVCRG